MRAGPLKQPVPAAPLLAPAELERLQQLALQYRSRSGRARQAPGPGRHQALARGQGMELYDVRPYQAGDDIRSMDWRATARSGRPTTRVFVEEHSRRLFLFIDRRPGMMFGTRRELKAATAARVAALLAFTALAEREPVAGLVFGEDVRHHAPAHTPEGVLPLLQHAAAAPPPAAVAAGHAPASPREAMRSAAVRQSAAGALIYLIGDFADVADGQATLADYLPPADRIQAVAIRIVDTAEQELPAAGLVRLAAPAGGPPALIDTSDPALRRRYRERMAAREAALRDACARHHVPLHTVSSRHDLLPQLEPLL
ncbi:MAG: DUF58 domain-containing protein [Gammaproteobacteria bacterium]|nr:DUF58 domain-containing protein [Gammaproteobacteria bacterium]